MEELKKESAFKPTKKTEYAFTIIVLIVLGSNLLFFPWDSLSSFSEEVTFELGYPYSFLVIDFDGGDEKIFYVLRFIIDFALYFFLAYLVDVSLTLIYRSFRKMVKEESITQ